MEYLAKLVLYLHITCGVVSLIVFWIPVFTRKGNHNHRFTGRIYVYLMWIVVSTAAILCIYNAFTGRFISAIFLGFLSILSANPLWYGNAILKNKRNISPGYYTVHLVFNSILFLFGLVLVYYGLFLINDGIRYLMLFFGILGITGILELFNHRKMKAQSWYRLHYTGMIGSGMAAYTAFFAFGGRRIIDGFLPGEWQILPWVLPTIIGLISLQFLNRHYEKKKTVSKTLVAEKIQE